MECLPHVEVTDVALVARRNVTIPFTKEQMSGTCVTLDESRKRRNLNKVKHSRLTNNTESKEKTMYNIKTMLAGKTVKFVKYRKGELFYTTECGFEFPVPVSDTGDGTFLAEDKAMTFMRWVRKQIASIEEGQAEQ